MATTMRINDKEEAAIRKKAIEINKKLIESGMAPVKDSELVHKILIDAINRTKLQEGKIIVV